MDIDGWIPRLLEDEPENEGEHDSRYRVRIETGDKMPVPLALPQEFSELLTLADSVTNDGRHSVTAQGLGPHLNSYPPAPLLDWVGEPVQVSVSQIVECLTGIGIGERSGGESRFERMALLGDGFDNPLLGIEVQIDGAGTNTGFRDLRSLGA